MQSRQEQAIPLMQQFTASAAIIMVAISSIFTLLCEIIPWAKIIRWIDLKETST